MRPPRCDVCGDDADPHGGLVQFLPRDSDVEWRERAAAEGRVGHPPDTAWMCVDHSATARSLAPLVHIGLALSQMRAAHERGAAPGAATGDRHTESRPPRGVDIGTWVRVLRRAMPDLALEAGCVEIEVEHTDGQPSSYPMDGLPAEVSPFTWSESWTVSDAGARVCLHTETARWNTHEIARVEAVMMVTSASEAVGRYVVGATSPVGSTRIGPEHVRFEGVPSPTMRALLTDHGLAYDGTGEGA